jgi:hypothetical protein
MVSRKRDSGESVSNFKGLDRAQLLMEKLLKQGYIAIKLKSLLQKCYGHHPFG